jgi:hypothetical protein
MLVSHVHAVLLQGAVLTREEVAQSRQLADARDRLAKALVGEVMDYDRNSPQLAAACVHTLLLMIGNVLADPGDEKKRLVRTRSVCASVLQKLLVIQRENTPTTEPPCAARAWAFDQA